MTLHDMRHPPLTQLIVDLLAASTARLARADPQRLAEHYGVRVDWAREYFQRARGLR